MVKFDLKPLVMLVTLISVCMVTTAIADNVGNYPGKWYGWWCPYVDGLAPQAGTIDEVENAKVIKSWGYKTDNSFEEIKDLIPDFFYNEVLLHPEIWGEFTINETEYIPHGDKPWLEATEKYKGTASLDERGQIQNYKAGVPFPGSTNPQEIGWNIVKRHTTGDTWFGPFVFMIVDHAGKTRWIAGKNLYYFFDGRLTMDPHPIYEPNPNNIEFIQTFGYLAPYDLQGTIPIVHRYNDPDKQDDMWMYLPSMRRVRRMSTAQRWDRVPGGPDIFWDNFEMFWGKPTNYDWKYLGRKELLCGHNAKWEVQMQKNKLIGGVDNNFQRINTVVVEVTPKIVSPVSKFVLYLDPVEYVPFWGIFYDKKGREWIGNLFEVSWDKRWKRDQPNMILFDLQRKHSSATYLWDTAHDIEMITPEFLSMESLRQYFGGR